MERSMSRRNLLVSSAGAMVVAGLPGAPVLAAEEHSGHAAPDRPLAAAARECVAEGDACLAHCLAMFATGDTSLAQCAKSVSEMLASCTAVAQLATLDAKRLGQFVGPCADICVDCEKECRKHADKHAVCKACADACARFIAEAKKVTAT